ncbi:MAG: IPT/TIG domain-containing protein [Acidobacteriia bacterium]|nr:IPT/TIG domain-containing protein [Terriglobia bacterium]
MRALAVLTVALPLASVLLAEAPFYSAASIVNAADNQPAMLAPNTIATIYGKNLAFGTKAITPDDIRGGTLPIVFSGTGAQVLIGSWYATLYYVSPTQINFLVPPGLQPGTFNLYVLVNGSAGPPIPVQLAAASPALFQLDAENAVATRADGSVITPAAPARPGDVVVLYATGLGQTTPPVVYGQLPTQAAGLAQIGDFSVLLDGLPVDPRAIAYAGIAPGFAGLYQINLTLPGSTAANPELRIGLAGLLSPPGLRLPVQP